MVHVNWPSVHSSRVDHLYVCYRFPRLVALYNRVKVRQRLCDQGRPSRVIVLFGHLSKEVASTAYGTQGKNSCCRASAADAISNRSFVICAWRAT